MISGQMSSRPKCWPDLHATDSVAQHQSRPINSIGINNNENLGVRKRRWKPVHITQLVTSSTVCLILSHLIIINLYLLVTSNVVVPVFSAHSFAASKRSTFGPWPSAFTQKGHIENSLYSNSTQAQSQLTRRRSPQKGPRIASINSNGKHRGTRQAATTSSDRSSHFWQDKSSKTKIRSDARAPVARKYPSSAGQSNQGQVRQQRQVSSTTQQQQQPSPGNSNKCALILQRTYVRKLANNDIDDSLGPNDQTSGGQLAALNVEPTGRTERVCVKFSDVNRAIQEAKQRRQFQLTDELNEAVQSIEPAPPFISQLGELNQEVTKILAERFDLSADEILNGLPLIDMSRTEFWPICPLMVKPIQCDPSGRFRSFTGHCNNLKNPTWGAAQTPFVRYLAPRHPDGIEKDRVSVLDASPLPSPRLVTSTIHHDQDSPSSDLSLLIMVWGQIIDHDVALAAPPRNEEGLDFNCCKQPLAARHPNCKPIEIPDNDPLYSRLGQKCMDFKRSLAGLRPNCALGPRVHINTITATIDGNTIYGSTKEVADQLRTFQGGLMKVQEIFASGGRQKLKPLLPRQLVRPDLDCFERPQNVYCFLGGDERVNEQPTLTVMHTIYVRDHNRLAGKLGQLNQHWDDDRIYHETRHLVAAMIQHVLVSEYLPMLIGHDMMEAYNLTEQPVDTYWSGYNSEVTPSISQGFTTAAFRQGHTFIQGRVQLYDSSSHSYMDSIQLRRLFKRPFHYYQPNRMDHVLAGIINTPAQSYDPFVTEEISGFLFQEPGEQFGMDLPAINLARGREQGTPGYTVYREWCGLPKVRQFKDLIPIMANRTAWQYARLYKHVDDIDLWSGGISERRMPGAQIGPTFACIIARQFANVKRGDRFWYEAGGNPSSFTMDQLREIKKASQARLICKNSDRMHMIQRQALKLAHPIYNPRVRCDDIPDVNLKYWREEPTNLGSFYTSS